MMPSGKCRIEHDMQRALQGLSTKTEQANLHLKVI
jgi:hypothetical protein